MSNSLLLIDLSLTCEGSLAERCDILMQRMDEWEQNTERRQRSLKDKDYLSRLISMRVLVSNLYEQIVHDPSGTFGLPKNRNWYSRRRAKFGPYLTHSGFWNSVAFFESQGWLRITEIGWKHKNAKQGKPTQIQATPELLIFLKQGDVKLSNLTCKPNLIILKDIKKKVIPVEENNDVKEMNKVISVINNVFKSSWVDLEITDVEARKLREKGIRFPSCLYFKREVYRVFNRNSFELGGRFYGGWWQNIPKDFRSRITIDGLNTVELDYSAIHPRMMYAQKGLKFEGDPYDIGLDVKYRPLVKAGFNRMINAYQTPRRPSGGKDKIVFDEKKVGMSWKEFLLLIQVRHSGIKELFSSGKGLNFQRVDSDIAEAIMLHFAEWNIPALPMHDSFIVLNKNLGELLAKMEGIIETKIGFKIPVKISETESDTDPYSMVLFEKWGKFHFYNPEDPNQKEPTLTLDDESPYAEYEKRVYSVLLKQHEETFTRSKLNSEHDAQVFAKLELSRLKNKRLSERKIK